jgi:putative FmdB family regulatory protein
MPIYEYECQDCAGDFEKLVASGEEVRCPDCGSTNVSRKIATFAAGSEESNDTASPGSCGTGGCCCGF